MKVGNEKWTDLKVCYKFNDLPGCVGGCFKNNLNVPLIHFPCNKRAAECALLAFDDIIGTEIMILYYLL